MEDSQVDRYEDDQEDDDSGWLMDLGCQLLQRVESLGILADLVDQRRVEILDFGGSTHSVL